ncbi:hypothetical protein EU537_05330 [Candidatus Thorarchaeota archaeon]|nr:MAG: hypothetical protein EU537_05330 [Candidatus Thorarchaeota archaeon]
MRQGGKLHMLVSERFLLPLTQFAKVPYWLLVYSLVMLSPSETFWSFLDLYAGIFIFAAAAEFIAGVAGLFAKSASVKYVFVILIWTFALGIPVIAQLSTVSLHQEPRILFTVLIEIITAVEFLFLRDERVRNYYSQHE